MVNVTTDLNAFFVLTTIPALIGLVVFRNKIQFAGSDLFKGLYFFACSLLSIFVCMKLQNVIRPFLSGPSKNVAQDANVIVNVWLIAYSSFVMAIGANLVSTLLSNKQK